MQYPIRPLGGSAESHHVNHPNPNEEETRCGVTGLNREVSKTGKHAAGGVAARNVKRWSTFYFSVRNMRQKDGICSENLKVLQVDLL